MPAAQRLPAFVSRYLVSPSASSQYEEGGSGLVPPCARERVGAIGGDSPAPMSGSGWRPLRGGLPYAFVPEAAFFGEGASSFVSLAVRARMFA